MLTFFTEWISFVWFESLIIILFRKLAHNKVDYRTK